MKKNRMLCAIATLVIVMVSAGTVWVLHSSHVLQGSRLTPVYAAATKPAAKAKPAPSLSPAEAAIKAAAARKRYTIVTFYKKGDAASDKMLATVRSVQGKLSARAGFTSADVGNPVHQGLMKRYGVDRAPIPLTLVLAPNGAVTAGFPKEVKSTDFSDVFVSAGMADVLKALQNGKLAAVCLQNSKTKYNKESLAAAQGLGADSRLSGRVGIIKMDPADRAESKFLQQCKVNTGSANSQIVLLVPPGKVLGAFDGNTTKDKLMADLQSALSSCGAGCGPSGCGP